MNTDTSKSGASLYFFTTLKAREVDGFDDEEGLDAYFSTSLVTFTFAHSSVTNILALKYFDSLSLHPSFVSRARFACHFCVKIMFFRYLFFCDSVAFAFQTSIKVRRSAAEQQSCSCLIVLNK
jgi:hypothetical protein